MISTVFEVLNQLHGIPSETLKQVEYLLSELRVMPMRLVLRLLPTDWSRGALHLWGEPPMS
jgi:hypothetical protein